MIGGLAGPSAHAEPWPQTALKIVSTNTTVSRTGVFMTDPSIAGVRCRGTRRASRESPAAHARVVDMTVGVGTGAADARSAAR